MGSGSPGMGSRFSGSGLGAFGQYLGGFGSHPEDSASLLCWSYGITFLSNRESADSMLYSPNAGLLTKPLSRGLHRPELPVDTHVPQLVPTRSVLQAR